MKLNAKRGMMLSRNLSGASDLLLLNQLNDLCSSTPKFASAFRKAIQRRSKLTSIVSGSSGTSKQKQDHTKVKEVLCQSGASVCSECRYMLRHLALRARRQCLQTIPGTYTAILWQKGGMVTQCVVLCCSLLKGGTTARVRPHSSLETQACLPAPAGREPR